MARALNANAFILHDISIVRSVEVDDDRGAPGSVHPSAPRIAFDWLLGLDLIPDGGPLQAALSRSE